MSETEKERRACAVMIRLTDRELATLQIAADAADRKPADLARLLVLRGLPGHAAPTRQAIPQSLARTEVTPIPKPTKKTQNRR